MKGADHLPLVARELKYLGIPFTMDICGGGEMEPAIQRDIQRFGLASQVRMRGTLDFENELLPFISEGIDLFVCCHRQGDPSCTYLETYSCGVPIVGYANEAFSGLVVASEVGGAGWVTPMDDPVALARKIAELSANRKEIDTASNTALAFATQHTFENTMSKRVQHLIECYKGQSNGAKPNFQISR
jgi:glycosyltransferase involved in cell wall biosynthesis